MKYLRGIWGALEILVGFLGIFQLNSKYRTIYGPFKRSKEIKIPLKKEPIPRAHQQPFQRIVYSNFHRKESLK
jgi:hypothetical protein